MVFITQNNTCDRNISNNKSNLNKQTCFWNSITLLRSVVHDFKVIDVSNAKSGLFWKGQTKWLFKTTVWKGNEGCVTWLIHYLSVITNFAIRSIVIADFAIRGPPDNFSRSGKGVTIIFPFRKPKRVLYNNTLILQWHILLQQSLTIRYNFQMIVRTNPSPPPPQLPSIGRDKLATRKISSVFLLER